MDLRALAVQAALAGWPVFPVHVYPKGDGTNAKVPLGGSDGHLSASADIGDVLAMEWEKANAYGIRPPRGVVGVDVDTKLGATGPAEMDAVDPAVMGDARQRSGVVVRTPSGGLHVYYRADIDRPPSTLNRKAPGRPSYVDLRGHETGWFVGPGSAGYELLSPSFRVADVRPMPAALYTHLGNRSQEQQERGAQNDPDPAEGVELDLPETIAKAAAYLAAHPSTGPAEYTHRYTLVSHIRFLGISEETAEEMMQDWNEAQEAPGYARPAKEIERGVKDAYRTAGGRPGAALEAKTASTAFAGLWSPDAPAEAPESGNRKRLTFRRFGEAKGLPPARWLVPGMILDRGLFAFFAGPKGGKTWAAVELACAAVTGQKWCGIEPIEYDTSRPVVYFALEGHDEIVERMKAWEAHHGVDLSEKLILVEGTFFAKEPSEVIAALEELRPLNPGLIFVDTFARASTGANENSAEDMNLLVAGLESMAMVLKCPVGVVHHSGKDEGLGMRGSNVLLAAVSSEMLVAFNNRDLSLTVTVTNIRRGNSGKELKAGAIKAGEFLVFTDAPTVQPAVIEGMARKRFLHALMQALFRLPDGETGTETRADLVNRMADMLAWDRRKAATYFARYVEADQRVYAKIVLTAGDGKPKFALGPATLRLPTMFELGIVAPVETLEPRNGP